MNLISVVIPSYNRSHTIRRAVESVLIQTYQNIEVIVVDDGSKDNTASILEQLQKDDPRIRYLCHSTNRGAQAARNTGIKAAQGEWIAFLDSDDEWLPHSLEARFTEANRTKVKVVHADGYIVRENHAREVYGVPKMRGKIYRNVLAHPGPLFPTLLVSKESLVGIGYLDEQIISWQEWDTSIRLAKYYTFGFVDEPIFVYDCREKNTISKDLLRDARGYEQIIRKHRLSILTYCGPRILAQHYGILAYKYERAEYHDDARRCRLLRFIWWPFHPRTIMNRLRRFLSSGEVHG